MSQLKRVGYGWMTKCSKLKHIDFTGFKALEVVGNDLISECSSLESISFAGDIPKLKKVGESWMSNCAKLKLVGRAGRGWP